MTFARALALLVASVAIAGILLPAAPSPDGTAFLMDQASAWAIGGDNPLDLVVWWYGHECFGHTILLVALIVSAWWTRPRPQPFAQAWDAGEPLARELRFIREHWPTPFFLRPELLALTGLFLSCIRGVAEIFNLGRIIATRLPSLEGIFAFNWPITVLERAANAIGIGLFAAAAMSLIPSRLHRPLERYALMAATLAATLSLLGIEWMAFVVASHA